MLRLDCARPGFRTIGSCGFVLCVLASFSRLSFFSSSSFFIFRVLLLLISVLSFSFPFVSAPRFASLPSLTITARPLDLGATNTNYI